MEEAPPVHDFSPASSTDNQSTYINSSFSVQPKGNTFMNMTKDYLPDKVKIGANEFEVDELITKAEYKGKQMMNKMQSFLGKDFAQMIKNFDVEKIDVKQVMLYHSCFSILIGVLTILFPSFFYSKSSDPKKYDYMAHEFCRLYGCLSLALGYIVLKSRSIVDGRMMKVYCESFGMIYCLQSFSMLLSQFSDPSGSHSFFHFLIALGALALGSMYGYIRFNKKMKSYELPGSDLVDIPPIASKKATQHLD